MNDYYVRPVDQAEHDGYMREAQWHAGKGNYERSDAMVARAEALRRPSSQTGRIDPSLTSRAQEHPSVQEPRFYHGTVSELRERSRIRPAEQTGHPGNFQGYDAGDYAYAADNPSTAGRYADTALNAAYNRNRGYGRSRRVYEVAPLGEHEPDPKESNGVRSKEGFRVIRRVPAREWQK